MKFGGSSVGSPESLKMVKQIIEKENEPVIVVVSALSGVTDRLLLAADFALNNNPGYKSLLEEIIKRHEEIIEKMILSAEIREEVTQKIQQLLDDLRNILRGVYLIGDLSQKTSDKIVSYGERLSSLIISYVIGDAELYDPMHFIKTSRQFHNHLPDLARCNQLIRKTFSEMPPPKVAVVPGFIASSSENGDITNLGRGGSDYTAAIIAAAMDATVLEIWTDVDGFMTADPRIINSAYVIEELSFIEAIELSNFGAKVIYPPTIFPVYHKNIPIRVKNTFRPECEGTLIRNIPLQSASQQFPNHQPVSPLPIRSRFFSAPSLSPPNKVQPEQEIRCSSIAHLVHKTCLQGQASGLKKISTFWRSACGSSLSKGSIFFATLAHTASTLSSCAPIHFAAVPLNCNVIGFYNPTAFPITAHLRSLRLVLIAAWLLVLLHNARSILTRGYSCPLKPQ